MYGYEPSKYAKTFSVLTFVHLYMHLYASRKIYYFLGTKEQIHTNVYVFGYVCMRKEIFTRFFFSFFLLIYQNKIQSKLQNRRDVYIYIYA